jgi:hypothetical protein
MVKKALKRMVCLPGFQDFADGFHVDEYDLDEDQWTEGFVTVN